MRPENMLRPLIVEGTHTCKEGKCPHKKCKCGHCANYHCPHGQGECGKINLDLTTCHCNKFLTK